MAAPRPRRPSSQVVRIMAGLKVEWGVKKIEKTSSCSGAILVLASRLFRRGAGNVGGSAEEQIGIAYSFADLVQQGFPPTTATGIEADQAP